MEMNQAIIINHFYNHNFQIFYKEFLKPVKIILQIDLGHPKFSITHTILQIVVILIK